MDSVNYVRNYNFFSVGLNLVELHGNCDFERKFLVYNCLICAKFLFFRLRA